MPLEVGTKPPNFTVKDDLGQDVPWAAFRGRPVAVFFYPKASTPGCTKEACAFRDLSGEFAKRGVRVVGMSADSTKAQAGFKHKYALDMPLLCDPGHVVLEPWGVWGEKSLYGKKMMGIRRSTFLFDKDGVLVKVWPAVKVDGHAEAVLRAVDEIFGA